MDKTEKYVDMIESFENDFNVAMNNSENSMTIPLASEKFLKDIELLRELSFNLRHDKLKIVTKE